MHVEEPAVVSVPVLTLQDPLAAVGVVVLDCRPPLLPVSMDIHGVDLSAAMDGLLPGREQLSIGGGGGGLVGVYLSGAWCDSFGGPRYRPGRRATDSPVGAIDEGMPLSPTWKWRGLSWRWGACRRW